MSEVKSRLSPTTKKAAATLEKRFPELSKQYCPDRQGKFCGKTGGRCEPESCPKMEERLKEYM